MKEVTESDFDSVTSAGLVLVDFGAEWCGPCKALLPILERFAREFEGKISVISVDIDQSPNVAARHGVMSVPTMLLFRGGRPVERIVGMLSEGALKKKLQPHLGAA